MSAPFLTTTIADMLVAVEAAWGADLTDLTGASWTWDDITADVLLQDGNGISITLGRPDFSSETQTAEMTCRLDNRSGEYSAGGMSPHWPYVRQGTPVRVQVSNNGGTNWYVRFQGSTNGFTPQWDQDTGRWATVELSASGPLRRLNQGTLPGFSAMRVGTMADSSVVAYWPMEEEQQSDVVVPAIGDDVGTFETSEYIGGAWVSKVGPPGQFASYTNIPSSAPIMTLQEFGSVRINRSSVTTGSSATVSALFGNPAGAPPGVDTLGLTDNRGGFFTVYTPNAASIAMWIVFYLGNNEGGEPGNTLAIRTYANETDAWNDYTFEHKIDFSNFRANTDYEIGLTLSQSGSTTNWTLWTNPCAPTDGLVSSSFSSSRSSNSNGAQVGGLLVAPFDDMAGLGVGHLAIRAPAMSPFTADQVWMRGHPGETTQARLTRLCAAHGIPLTVVSASDVPNSSIIDSMGPQYYDTLTNLLRECETTGQGVLYDGLGPGLTYVTKRRRETNANSAATLTVAADLAQLMEPFAPVDDDQLMINHCDVSRRSGATATYMDRTGPMGVDAVGDYATSYTVNTDTDTDLVRYAQWTVGVGSQQGYRYPSVSFALETNPGLIPGWLACLPQSRIDVTSVATIRRQHPDETIKLLLEGWQETITAFTWRVTANTSSAEPWKVAVLAAATGSTGDGICHLQTESSQLNANYTSGTTISVRTNTGVRWITTGEDSDSFPFDVDVGGVRATVTGITSTSSPQTFTLSAELPRTFTGSTTAGAGTPVKVWRPPVYGL